MPRLIPRRYIQQRERLWIGEAIRQPGALSRQLGIVEEDNIPTSLLRAIQGTPLGTELRNPTKVGKARIRATLLLKRRVNLALTLRGFQ